MEIAPGGVSEGLLNESAIAELRELLADELPDFLLKFRDNCIRQMNVARAALADGDGVVLQRAVHTLKGSAGVVGATSLAEACLEFESRLKAGNRENAAAYLAGIERLSQAVVESLERRLAG